MVRAPVLDSDLCRFGIVSVLGLGVDLSLAWALAVLAGISLPAAAVFGFLAGAVLNYVLHELWTFQNGVRRLSARRGGIYALSLGLTLGTRIAMVVLLEKLFFTGSEQELLILLAATGTSFLINYALSKHFVFREESAPAVNPPTLESG